MNIKVAVISLLITVASYGNANNNNTPATQSPEISHEEYFNDLQQISELKRISQNSEEQKTFDNIARQLQSYTAELNKKLKKCSFFNNCQTSHKLKEIFINFNKTELAFAQARKNLENSTIEQEITAIQKNISKYF